MTNNELNEFIRHYIEQDKTRSAIMLTAPWGAGKSYYLQNHLIPYLNGEITRSTNNTYSEQQDKTTKENEKERKEKNKKAKKCITVSLYGLKTLNELSKELYIESKTPAEFKKRKYKKIGAWSKPIVTGFVGIGKTVLKSLTEIDLDFSVDNPNWQKLYSSVDYSGKLIILEDLERSGIDILEVMGYVNNLVEQDGVKVLLVANEDELIQYEPINEETQEKQETAELIDRVLDHKGRKYTENTKKYLATKEKTVSDTIMFDGDYSGAIKHIMSGFSKTYFHPFLADSAIGELLLLLQTNHINNLRTFIFACQKSNDIFEYVKPDPIIDSDFIKTVFYGIILFSQKIKSGTKVKWEGGQDFSIEMSSEKYPLFRFCYDYVLWQTLDVSRIDAAKEALGKLRLYDKRKSFGDKDLRILYNWWICSENDVTEAVRSITERLKDESDISFYEYGRIALYLIGAKSITGCDITNAKELLVKNLYNKGSEIDPDYLFTTILSNDEKPEIIKEFEDLKADMIASLISKDSALFDFDYKPESISVFHNKVRDNHGRIIRAGSFISRLDLEKIAEMLKQCSADNIQDFRGAFLSVYEPGNIRDFLEGDKEPLEQLLTRIEELSTYDGFDKIQKMQLRFFEENLNMIIAKL